MGGGGGVCLRGTARKAQAGLQRGCVHREARRGRPALATAAGTSVRGLSRTARNGGILSISDPEGRRQGRAGYPSPSPELPGGWLSKAVIQFTPHKRGTPTPEEGGLGSSTYLPAVPTLVADNKRGHRLVRAAGLHLWEDVVRTPALRSRSSLESQPGRPPVLGSQPWGP